MRLVALGLLGFAVGACGPAGYSSGALARAGDVDARSVRSVGCLDVALALRQPAHAGDAALLVVRVGNRCVRPVAFDLRQASIVAHDAEGDSTPLKLVDPRDEIGLLHVDAAAQGVEKVRLSRGDAEGELRRVCVDVSRTVPDAQAPAPPVCFQGSFALGWEVSP
ncbi:MAG: hypothetical protein HYV09_21535 [Deltaproteobacteria bacterium]|nr:hypothetical protein [Deltaproteobacteria bacterium]